MLAELLFENVGCSINTYARNYNSGAVYHMDSMNTVANEKRLNGLLESNREELLLNPWLGVGYIPGELNTSDSMTKSMSSANLRSLLAENTFQIATEQMKNQIRKKLPAAKTLHRISGYDARTENVESRDKKEDEAERPVAVSRVFLKAKTLN